MAKNDAATTSLKTGMLSFARLLQLSEGLFWGTRSNDAGWREPVEVIQRGVRGQSSEFNTKKPGKSNPQVVEAAAVPLGSDGIKLEFSLWVAPQSRKPWACGDREVGQAYERFVGLYAEKGGFAVLAERFLWNIANGRFAWRNRFHADDMRVTVEFSSKVVAFDPTRLDLDRPASLDRIREAVDSNDLAERDNADALAQWIQHGLETEQRFLKVTWWAAKEEAQEVFPSQEYLREEKGTTAPSRVYAKLSRFHGGRTVQQASMHSQKIGAALRHIDNWHGNDGPTIAVNPYGGVQETGAVLRDKDTEKSFYDLRDKAAALFDGVKNASGRDDITGDAHFVVANLVRGGVFGQQVRD